MPPIGTRSDRALILYIVVFAFWDRVLDRRRLPNLQPPTELIKMPLQKTRLSRFRLRENIGIGRWAREAGISGQALHNMCNGADSQLTTIRKLVRSSSEILTRRVHAIEMFDLGEDTPTSEILSQRRVATPAELRTVTHYQTRLDRILRGQQIMPGDFARHVGISRNSLFRFRSGRQEPNLFTLANMVRTIRLMTGKRYLASHLYDVGEGLTDLRTAA
jgi:predicted transcriptional regulator